MFTFATLHLQSRHRRPVAGGVCGCWPRGLMAFAFREVAPWPRWGLLPGRHLNEVSWTPLHSAARRLVVE